MIKLNGVFSLRFLRVLTIAFTVISLASCSSSIVSSEAIRTSSAVSQQSTTDKNIDIVFVDTAPTRSSTEVGRVSARAWLLEKGIEAIKQEALKLGADAVINVKYERRFSADYLQDLYFIDGTAVVWSTSTKRK
jgi:uncharacterized protein YbjQ (UPF0145 family)